MNAGLPPDNIQILAENFQFNAADQIDFIRFWGGYFPGDIPQNPDCFTVIFREADGGGLPGTEINRLDCVPATARVRTGTVLFGVDEYEYTIEIEPNKVLGDGTFWVEIYNDTSGNTDTWIWESGTRGPAAGIRGFGFTFTLPEPPWIVPIGDLDFALELVCKGPEERPVKWSQPPIRRG